MLLVHNQIQVRASRSGSQFGAQNNTEIRTENHMTLSTRTNSFSIAKPAGGVPVEVPTDLLIAGKWVPAAEESRFSSESRC
jgi:hypothetical protein